MADRSLTLKQEKFAAAYVGSAQGNASEAARLAGYSGDARTLGVSAHDTLKNPKVAAQVRQWMDQYVMSEVECMQLVAEVGRIPIDRFFSAGKDSRVSLGDKVAALTLIAKVYGLEKRTIEITGEEGGPIRLLAYIKPEGM